MRRAMGTGLWALGIVLVTLPATAGGGKALKGEIKNVITVVAKTTHYWTDHLQVELKRAADTEVKLDQWIGRVKRLFGRADARTV